MHGSEVGSLLGMIAGCAETGPCHLYAKVRQGIINVDLGRPYLHAPWERPSAFHKWTPLPHPALDLRPPSGCTALYELSPHPIFPTALAELPATLARR